MQIIMAGAPCPTCGREIEAHWQTGAPMPHEPTDCIQFLREQNEMKGAALGVLRAENERLRGELDAARRVADDAGRETKRLREIIAHAEGVIDDVQLIDNTPDEADQVRRELLAALGA